MVATRGRVVEGTSKGARGMSYYRPHSKEPFTLNESEIMLIHDLLDDRIKQAEKDLSVKEGPSREFRSALLYKFIDAYIWSRNGDVVTVSSSTKTKYVGMGEHHRIDE